MATGAATTYNLTTGVMLDFEPLIVELDPFDVPLLGTTGAFGESAISKGSAFEKKVEWQDETSLTPRSLTATTAVVTADTYITIATGERERFQTDDIILIEAEYLRITGYGTTADTLTVSRAWSGTAASHATGKAIVGVGSAPVEGADPSAARVRDRTARYNMTEIFGPYKVEVTGSENAVRKYGLPGTEFAKQAANRTKEAAIGMEQAIIYGARVDDGTSRRSMGGLDYYITTNVDSSTTTLTETKLLDLLQTCFDTGGSPNRITCGSKQKRLISGFTSFGQIQVQRADNERGVVVDVYNSDFGRCAVMLDRWYRTQDLHIWERDQAELVALRPLAFEMLAKTGDAEKGMLVGEYSLRFRRQAHAAKFTALT